PPVHAQSSGITVLLNPSHGLAGSTVAVSAKGWGSDGAFTDGTADIQFDNTSIGSKQIQNCGDGTQGFGTNCDSVPAVNVTVPSNAKVGRHTIKVVISNTSGSQGGSAIYTVDPPPTATPIPTSTPTRTPTNTPTKTPVPPTKT